MYEGLKPSCYDGDELEHLAPEAAEAAVRALKDAAYGGAAHILAPRVTEEAAQMGECIPRAGGGVYSLRPLLAPTAAASPVTRANAPAPEEDEHQRLSFVCAPS
jgi:hypothetical protein